MSFVLKVRISNQKPISQINNLTDIFLLADSHEYLHARYTMYHNFYMNIMLI